MMESCWGISIDIEGFSKNYEYSEKRKTFAILALSELMSAIIQIGRKCFPGNAATNFSERLFAHQFGDGFVICSDYPEVDISRALSIAVALMRHMMLKGFVTKAAISSGDMSDIKGCYPNPVREAHDEPIDLGMGLMTIIPVMGTALTKSHKLAAAHSGAVLIVDRGLIDQGLPKGTVMHDEFGICIDWIHSKLPFVDQIIEKSGLVKGDPARLAEMLRRYCINDPVPPTSWINATVENIGINLEGS